MRKYDGHDSVTLYQNDIIPARGSYFHNVAPHHVSQVCKHVNPPDNCTLLATQTAAAPSLSIMTASTENLPLLPVNDGGGENRTSMCIVCCICKGEVKSWEEEC